MKQSIRISAGDGAVFSPEAVAGFVGQAFRYSARDERGDVVSDFGTWRVVAARAVDGGRLAELDVEPVPVREGAR